LLDATTSLRKQQEEESKLADRLADQRDALAAAEGRYAEAARKLAEARATARQDLSAVGLLDAMKKDVESARQLARKTLSGVLRARKETLAKLRAKLAEPGHSEEKIAALQDDVRGLTDSVGQLTSELTSAQRAAGDERLAQFRQQAAAMARRLADKEDQLETTEQELHQLDRDLQEKVSRAWLVSILWWAAGSGGGNHSANALSQSVHLSIVRALPFHQCFAFELVANQALQLSRSYRFVQESKLSELRGPKFMTQEEFAAFAAALRAKTGQVKELKAELSALKDSSAALATTETELKKQASEADAGLRLAEEERGVAGYSATVVSSDVAVRPDTVATHHCCFADCEVDNMHILCTLT